jgi:hypothetical protein
LIGVDQVDDSGCLAGARRTVEEEVGKIGCFYDVGENLFVGRIKDNIVEIGWSVFLRKGNPCIV